MTSIGNLATPPKQRSCSRRRLGNILLEIHGAEKELFSGDWALAERNRLAHSFYRQHNFRRNTEEGGALLPSNRYVPLALVLLAPVTVNIVAFHAFLAPSGAGVGMAAVVLQLFSARAS